MPLCRAVYAERTGIDTLRRCGSDWAVPPEQPIAWLPRPEPLGESRFEGVEILTERALEVRQPILGGGES
jgi:hypothetical protein